MNVFLNFPNVSFWAMTSSSQDKPLPITPQEEKDLHRVFELLSDYQQKTKIKQEIKELQSWYNSNRHKTFVDVAQGEKSLRDAQERIEYLQKELQAVESKPDKKISVNDVYEMYKWLGQKISKKDVEEVVWEVDEGLDGYIDWNEFRLMFNRNITDRTGLEPSRMVSVSKLMSSFHLN